MFWAYILCCADGSYYTGHTDDLEKRMAQYDSGECDGYVANHLPVKLAWSQECATRYEALSAEQQIKGWSRKKKEAMMIGNWQEVSLLAQSKATVRPELVEGKQLTKGKNSKAVRAELVEAHTLLSKFAHPSTSSGRTDMGGEA